MKRLFTSAIPFIIILVAIDYGIGIFIENYGLTHNQKTIDNIFKNKGKMDAVFIGSSHTYSGIDPSVFAQRKIKIMNLGLATAGPIYYQYIIDAYLDHNPAPKVMVIETAYHTFTDVSDNIKYNYFVYLDSRSRMKYYFRYNDMKNLINSLSRAYINRDYFTGALRVLTGRAKKANWHDGFICLNGTLNDSKKLTKDAATYYNHFHGLKGFNRDKIRTFNNILSSMKSRKIRVLLIDIPEYVLINNTAKYQPLRDEYKRIAADLAAKYGYKYVDFNTMAASDSIKYDKNLFRSVDHLNCQGAKIASKMILEYLLIKMNL